MVHGNRDNVVTFFLVNLMPEATIIGNIILPTIKECWGLFIIGLTALAVVKISDRCSMESKYCDYELVPIMGICDY